MSAAHEQMEPQKHSVADLPLLEVRGLSVNYGGIQALQAINLVVNVGEVVTLIGANGAGKTTTLRTISRILAPRHGQIVYAGRDITRRKAHEVVALGMAHCPEGRRVLAKQTILDNLELGAYVRSQAAEVKQDIEQQFQLFPRLAERRHQLAGTLSGGEQQMLAFGRALVARPKLLLLDEPSMGLAPTIVQSVAELITAIRREGLTVLLVEQNAELALSLSDEGYVMETGQIVLSGPAVDIMADQRVRDSYLGV